MNGRWMRKLSIATASVGGDFSIVAASAAGSRPIAAKVSAMLANSCACTAATGATWAEARPICLKNSFSCVEGFERLAITGAR